VSPLPTAIIEPKHECLQNYTSDSHSLEPEYCKNFADDLSSFSDVVRAYRAYATAWEQAADVKKQQATAASEVTFYGLLTSAVGLATKSPETVIVGGTLGAAGAIYSRRYSLEIQSHNYDVASQAMQCMYMAAQPYKNSRFIDENAMRDSALELLVNIRIKLKKLQSNLVLATPNFSELQSAITGIPVIASEVNIYKYIPRVRNLFVPQEQVEHLLKSLKICESQLN
jgi:hypothetical protein